MELEEMKARYGNPRKFIMGVRAEMALHNISKRALAREMGVDRRDLQRWLAHEHTPRLENLLRLDEALKRLLR